MDNGKSFTVIVSTLLLAGCASRASEITPSYVSPVGYQSYTCEQLGQEAQTVSRRAAIASGQQDKIQHDDTVKTTVGLLLFWPVLLFNKGDGMQAGELANLKGQMQAIQDESVVKNCGFKFHA